MQKTTEVHNSPFPYLYFENIYSNDELVEIYDELDFYTRNRHRYFSNTTEPATDDEGISLKQNKSYFVPILNPQALNSSACAKYTLDHLSHPKAFPVDSKFFSRWKPACSGFLISYYTNGDYYHAHTDVDVASLVVWIYKEPKKFEGGEFIFPDYPEVKIPTNNNCAIMFPGRIRHQVNEIKMAENDNGFGRYSFTVFLDHHHQRR